MKIAFQPDCPKDVAESVRPHLEEFSYLCPLWMQRVEVGYWYGETEFTLQMNLNTNYREALLKVAPKYLQESPERRRELICHEIVHCLTIPLKQVALEGFEDLKAEDPAYSILCRKVDDVMERVTQDFAYSIAYRNA